MNTKKLFLSALLLIGTASSVSALPTAKQLIQRMDTIHRGETSRAALQMTISTPNWTRILKMKAWSRGLEKTFIRISSPRKDRGVSTLRKGKEMWNFFPKVNRVVKVPPSMMMGSWMGSDFTNDDLVRETSWEKEYAATVTTANEGNYLLTLTPRENTATVWGKVTFEISPKNLVPVEQTFFSEKGKAMKKMVFSKIKKIGSSYIPLKLEMIPLNKNGHKTTVEYQKLELDINVPESTFGLRNLKSRL